MSGWSYTIWWVNRCACWWMLLDGLERGRFDGMDGTTPDGKWPAGSTLFN